MDGISVLLIDDEQEFVTTLAERLELRGLRVRTAFDGQEGLLKVMQELPDVVVVDMLMPGLSGADMTQALKSRYPNMPVILLTGHAALRVESDMNAFDSTTTADNADDMPLSGVYACLTKPVALEIVWDTLHNAVKAARTGK